ncbi:MAG: hypothetical protein LC795_21160 [Acidobacteria bacterium]|nr:hypothetical protein [Acidobacteriota bacterium]
MSKRYFLIFALLAPAALGWQAAAAAQFPRLPKIERPKPEQPKTTAQPATTAQPEADASRPRPSAESGDAAKQGAGRPAGLDRPAASNRPVLLKDTLEIKAFRVNYWKSPEQGDYWSWLPQVRFFIFFDNSSTQRFTADWYKPDGSLWFSEPLKYGHASGVERVVRITSDHPDAEKMKNTAITTGTYGLKVTNAKSGEVAFQGKFRVNRVAAFPDEPKYKNRFEFYVEEDWLLPVAYVGYEDDANWEAPHPFVWMWFKGQRDVKDFEARLLHNGRQIASTDENCNNCVRTPRQERGTDSCSTHPEQCQWHQWGFHWKNFVTINTNYDYYKTRVPNTTATNEAPGEYTVQIFYRNVLVREAKFTVNDKGSFHPNAFSEQLPAANYTILVPAKISGEKWSPATFKTDMFYGNPVSGFNVP